MNSEIQTIPADFQTHFNEPITYEEFIKLFNKDTFLNDKSDIIKKKLKNVIVILNNSLYSMQSNMTFEKNDGTIDDFLKNSTTTLLSSSFKALSQEHKDQLKLIYPNLVQMCNNQFVTSMMSQLKTALSVKVDEVKFDRYYNQIHYNNGYLDLETLEFKNREVGKHFITKYIKRNYKASTQAQRDKLIVQMQKIFPNKKDMDCIFTCLGSALSGFAIMTQDLLFLLGEGANGKSFIMELTAVAIECYLKELKDDTFSANNAKIDKIMNSFDKNPQVRITWINEPKDTKMDESLMKNFCDGKVQTTKLFAEESHTIPLFAKAVFSMNSMPVTKSDPSLKRRVKGFTFKSKFTENDSEVDYSKHIYARDNQLLYKLGQEQLYDAWVDILAQKCSEWLKTRTIEYTENFESTKQEVMDANDKIQDFIDANLIITNDQSHQIGRLEMHEAFKNYYPKSFISPLQLVTELKTKKIEYDFNKRTNKLKGTFFGVQFQQIDKYVQLEPEENPLDYGIKQDLAISNINEDLLKELEQLRKENAELKAMLNKINNPIKQETTAEAQSNDTVIVKPKKKKSIQTSEELDAECEQLLKPTIAENSNKYNELQDKLIKMQEMNDNLNKDLDKMGEVLCKKDMQNNDLKNELHDVKKILKSKKTKKVKISEAFKSENISNELEDEFDKMTQIMMAKK